MACAGLRETETYRVGLGEAARRAITMATSLFIDEHRMPVAEVSDEMGT
jgi:hypothetical protein